MLVLLRFCKFIFIFIDKKLSGLVWNTYGLNRYVWYPSHPNQTFDIFWQITQKKTLENILKNYWHFEWETRLSFELKSSHLTWGSMYEKCAWGWIGTFNLLHILTESFLFVWLEQNLTLKIKFTNKMQWITVQLYYCWLK